MPISIIIKFLFEKYLTIKGAELCYMILVILV